MNIQKINDNFELGKTFKCHSHYLKKFFNGNDIDHKSKLKIFFYKTVENRKQIFFPGFQCKNMISGKIELPERSFNSSFQILVGKISEIYAFFDIDNALLFLVREKDYDAFTKKFTDSSLTLFDEDFNAYKDKIQKIEESEIEIFLVKQFKK